MGLREQIKNAATEAELTDLLSKGKNFELASEYTKRAWKSTARFRLAELNNPVPAQNPSKPVVNKKTAKKKTK